MRNIELSRHCPELSGCLETMIQEYLKDPAPGKKKIKPPADSIWKKAVNRLALLPPRTAIPPPGGVTKKRLRDTMEKDYRPLFPGPRKRARLPNPAGLWYTGRILFKAI
jgi:hypothetical protein